MSTATCQTEGCSNAGIAIPDVPSEWTDGEGATHPIELVVCGVCGQPIEDVQA